MARKPSIDFSNLNITEGEKDIPVFRENPFIDALNASWNTDKAMMVDVPVPEGMTPEDVAKTTKASIRSGAAILEMGTKTDHEVSTDGKSVRVHFKAKEKTERPRKAKNDVTDSPANATTGNAKSPKSAKNAA